MSIIAMNEVWEIPHLQANERLLLLAIASHINNEGICWPSAERLRKKCCWGSTATYTRYIKILKSAGLIIKKPRADTLTGRQTDLISMNHSNIHPSELLDRLKAARAKLVRRNAINSHEQIIRPTKGLKPEVFTRTKTNYNTLSKNI